MITRIKDRRELIEYLRYAIADYKSMEGDNELTAEINISLDLGRAKITILGEEDD